MLTLSALTAEHEYLSAKCLKCKCERWNKKRLHLCSSAVYGNMQNCDYELFTFLSKLRSLKNWQNEVKGFFSSFLILYHFDSDLSRVLILAAQKLIQSFLMKISRFFFFRLEDQRVDVKLVYHMFLQDEKWHCVLYDWSSWGVFLFNSLITQYSLTLKNPVLWWESKHWRAGSRKYRPAPMSQWWPRGYCFSCKLALRGPSSRSLPVLRRLTTTGH